MCHIILRSQSCFLLLKNTTREEGVMQLFGSHAHCNNVMDEDVSDNEYSLSYGMQQHQCDWCDDVSNVEYYF